MKEEKNRLMLQQRTFSVFIVHYSNCNFVIVQPASYLSSAEFSFLLVGSSTNGYF
jgi:hypothetical protein